MGQAAGAKDAAQGKTQATVDKSMQSPDRKVPAGSGSAVGTTPASKMQSALTKEESKSAATGGGNAQKSNKAANGKDAVTLTNDEKR